jgi:hypothetical protein
MFRRFELYAVRPDASPDEVHKLERACRDSGCYIPDVLDSAVGRNLSEAPVGVVWEQAYASPESYQRYMVHPYHAAVIDRHILSDCPERVVADDTLGAGLVGYACDEPRYRMTAGVRRVVLLRVDREASGAELDAMCAHLESVPEAVPAMTVSVVGTNTMGSAWFDGVTPIMGPPRWTHLWEQGFSDLAQLEEYREGPSELAAAERAGWEGWRDGVVVRSAHVFYEIDALDGPASG